MNEDEIEQDVELFFNKYTVSKGIDGIEPEDVPDVFLLYMSQYLMHKDYSGSEKLN